MNRFLSKKAAGITPYVAGEQPSGSDIIKLNTNENPFPPSPNVYEAIKAAIGASLRKYPEPSGGAFRDAAAALHGVSPAQVFCGNGSDEVLAFAFNAFFGPERPLYAPDITYSFYPVWAKLYDIPYHTIELDENFYVPLEKFKNLNAGVVIANPNAPTGIALSKNEIETIVSTNSNHVVIIDEAYIEFGGESAVDLVNTYDNLLVVRTLSKAQSLAGIRAGYAVGSEPLIDGLRRIKDSVNSYPVNRITAAAAAAALEDEAYYKALSQKVVKTRDWTANGLKALGFDVLPSKANFVFASPNKMPAGQLFEALKARKIYVRWFNLPRIDDFLRITIGTDEEMETLVLAVKEIYKGV